MKNTLTKKIISLLGGYFAVFAVVVSAPLFAQTASSNKSSNQAKWQLDAFLDTRVDDNPLRLEQPDDSERQHEYGLNGSIDATSGKTSLTADYNIERNTFSEESQQDETVWTGQSNLGFTEVLRGFSLEFEHSIGRVLNQPDSVDLISNTREKESFSVSPSYKARVSAGTALLLQGTFSDTSYEELELNDSRQNAVLFQFQRQIQPSLSYAVGVNQTSTRFDTNTSSDYDQRRLFLDIRRQFDHFDYLARVGVSEVSYDNSDRENINDAFFELEANYRRFGNVFYFYASSMVTDSSTGSSVTDFTTNSFAQEGNIGVQDQIEEKNMSFSYNTRNVCGRCAFGLDFSYKKLEYLTEVLNDTGSLKGEVAFDYSVTKNTTLELGHRYISESFDNDSDRDFDEQRSTLGVRFKRGQLSIVPRYEYLDRNVDSGGGYDSEVWSLLIQANLL